MANRNFKRVQSLNNETKIIAGHFAVTAAGAATKVSGLGWSVTSATCGRWNVTLEDDYPSVISITASAYEAIVIDDNTIVTDKSFTIRAPGGDFDGEVHFTVILNNSTVS